MGESKALYPQREEAPIHTPVGASQRVPYVFDGVSRIFSMYLEMALEEDKKMVENWEADADGIFIFWFILVATLISVSIQDIRQNSQDASTFYLANIYRVLADQNRSNVPLPASPPLFSLPTYAVWVNSLWFLSLIIGLSCALLAALLRKWSPRFSAHVQARIHAFFAEGVEKFHLVWAVEALHTLLHVSLFLLFAGLVVFLWNVDLTIFKLVLSCVSVCTILYGYITVMPIFHHDSPYYTPLSSLTWRVVNGTLFVALWAIRCLGNRFFSRETYRRVHNLENHYHKLRLQGVVMTAEETARNLPSGIDARAFMRTFESLHADDELESFFEGLPGFRNSKVVGNPLSNLTEEQKTRLSEELVGFMGRTFSSDILSEPVKHRRAIICAKAIDPTDFPKAFEWIIHSGIVPKDQYSPLRSADIGHIVKGWANSEDEHTGLLVKALVSTIVALERAQRRDDSWFALASGELGVPESTLRDHATHGDSLSLAILIHVTQKHFTLLEEYSWPWSEFSEVLETASKFNIQDTSPELQREFCALWNQIALKVRTDDNRTIAQDILKRIRDVFVALHQDTDAPLTKLSASFDGRDRWPLQLSSYPLCNIPSHHPDLTLRTHDVSAPTIVSRGILHDGPTHVPAALSAWSSSKLVPLHVDEDPTDVPPLNNTISILPVTVSLHLPQQTIFEGSDDLDASPTLATAGAIRVGADAPHKVTRYSPTKKSTTTSLFASTSAPSGPIVPQQNAVLRISSLDIPDVSPSPSPVPVLDNILPTIPQLSSDPSATRPEYASPWPEESPPVASRPLPTSARDVGVTGDGKGSTQAELPKGEGLFDLRSANPINAVVAPGHKSPSPTLP